MTYKELIFSDKQRYRKWFPHYLKRFSHLLRKCQTTKGIVNKIYKCLFICHCNKKDIGFPKDHVGKGLRLVHPSNITVHNEAVIGDNVEIYKGVTIGREGRGKRIGVPTIGNKVWIGANAVIVGNVKIGNDVLIAANSFVNFDVPDHSIVFGNPGNIKHCDNATDVYLKYLAD